MKKALGLCLCLTLVLGAVLAGHAETDLEKARDAIYDAFDRVFKGGDDVMIDSDTLGVLLTEKDEILIYAEAGYGIRPSLLKQTHFDARGAAEGLTLLWQLFALASAEHTDAPVSMFITYKDDVLYFVWSGGVIDVENGLHYDLLKTE